METQINERIGVLVDKFSKSQSDFANKIGRKSQTISSIINNGSKPGAEVLQDILKTFPQVDALWLVCGIGEMQKDISANFQSKDAEMLELLKRENQILIRNNESLLEDKKRLWNMVDTIGKKLEANKWTRVVKLDLQHFKKQA